jgi:hypothetical protein
MYDPRMISTIMTADGPRLGVWVARNLVGLSSAFVRPSALGSVTQLYHRSLVATSSVVDKQFLTKEFGTSFDNTASVESARADGAVVAASPATKVDSQKAVLKTMAMELLVQFGDSLWEGVKESRFTAVLTKFSSFRTDVSNKGDKHSVCEIDEWITGLSSGKAFAKGYREFQRAKNKDAKFVEVSEKLVEFREFLLMSCINIVPYYPLDLLYFKAEFVTAFGEPSDQQPLDEIVKDVFSKGLCSTMARAIADVCTVSGSPKLCVDEWLRSILLKFLADAVEVYTVDDMQNKLESLAKELLQVVYCSGNYRFGDPLEIRSWFGLV